MGIKFFDLVNGYARQFTAAVVGGIASANNLVATNTSGLLDISFFPAGLGADIVTVPATEAIAAGAPINLFNNAGVASMRNADATAANAGKICDGFVQAAVAAGVNGQAYRSGTNTSQSGLTPGQKYFLGPNGTFVSTPPTGSGNTVQLVGTAVSATAIDVQPGPVYVLA